MTTARASISNTRNAYWSDVLLPFLLSRLMILVTGVLAISFGSLPPDLWRVSSRPWLDMWARWDSGFYLQIATEGYSYSSTELSNLAFFPLYPLLIRIFSLGAKNPELLTAAGVIISNVAALTAFYLLYRLVLLDENRGVGRRTIWLLAFFPTSFFLSMIYTEGLFLMLTVAAFYAARRHWWLATGLLGALSAVTRTIGVLLIAPLAYEWWMQKPRRWQTLLSLALIPLGLGLYLLFLDARFGNPLIFADAQASWGRSISLQGAISRAQELLSDPALSQRAIRSGIDLVFMALGAVILITMSRKLRPSYFIYAAYCFLVPLATLQVLSMPRLLIVIFPFFILMATYLHRPVVFRTTVIAFTLLQIVFVARWSLWFWVA